MTDWSTSIGALGNDISTDLTTINNDFKIVKTIWDGDHTALSGTGTSSTTHAKVTLPARTVPATPTAQGILYTKAVSTATELFYLDPAGNEAQITSGGSIGVGTHIFANVNGAETLTAPNTELTLLNSRGVSTFKRTAAATFEVTFTTPFTAPNATSYVALIEAYSKGTGTANFVEVHTVVKTAEKVTFKTYKSSSTSYNPTNLSILILRNG